MEGNKPTQQELAALAASNFANSDYVVPKEESIDPIAASIDMIDKISEQQVRQQGVPPLPVHGKEESFNPTTVALDKPTGAPHQMPVMQTLGEESRIVQPQVKMENYWEITGLPSTGGFYSGKKIMGRPLNVLEVKMLASINEGNVNHVINQVLSRVLRGITVEEFLVADKLYIIFWLRANTYKDDGYKVEFDCLSCGATSDYEFGLDMLNVEEIKKAYLTVNEMTTPGGTRFKARYLTVKDENKVSDFLGSYKGSEEFDEEILNLSNMIISINGEEKTLLQKYAYFLSDECSPQDYAYIESFIRHIDFGVDPIMQVKCTKCGGTSPVAISFRADFFIPQYTFK